MTYEFKKLVIRAANGERVSSSEIARVCKDAGLLPSAFQAAVDDINLPLLGRGRVEAKEEPRPVRRTFAPFAPLYVPLSPFVL